MAHRAVCADHDQFSFEDAVILSSWIQGAIDERAKYAHLLD